MPISDSDVRELQEAGIIDDATADAICGWVASRRQAEGRSAFDMAHLGYWLGGLVIVSAQAWLLAEGYDHYGAAALLGLSLVYALAFAGTGEWLWRRSGLRAPAGLLFTLAACMAPLVGYGLLDVLGLLPATPAATADGGAVGTTDTGLALERAWALRYAFLQAVMVAAGLAVLRWRRFAFAVVPVGIALLLWWDGAAFLVAGHRLGSEEYHWLHIAFGLVTMALAARVTRAGEGDTGFWLWLIGGVAAWGGMTLLPKPNEAAWALYLAGNLVLLVTSIVVRRRALTVLGAMGVAGYLGHLAWEVFADSMLFPVVLMLVGVGIIVAAVAYRRHEAAVEAAVRRLLRLPEVDRPWPAAGENGRSDG